MAADAPFSSRERRLRQASLALPLFLTGAILARHLDFVPIWDARSYYDALIEAVGAHFNPLNFNIFSHPSMLFFLWTALGQFVDPGNAVLLNLSQLVLALLGVASFRAIARKLFPGRGAELELLLLTAAFAVCPVFLASVQNVNPDTGVCVFLLVYLAMLFQRRFFLAALAGLFLVSSKESGVLLYPIATGLYFVAFGTKGGLGKRIGEALRKSYGFAPLVFYGLTILASRMTGRIAVWSDPTGAGRKEGLLRLFLVPWSGPLVQNAYVSGFCILNFGWVLTLFIIAALLTTLARVLRHRPTMPEGVDRRFAAVLLPLLLVAGYVLTRFPTFTNVRYLLPVFPIYLLGFAISLRALFRSRGARVGALIAVVLLSLVSVFRTVDPVSKALYGTFPFGRHEMLVMTSITRECCGYGRDQLEYNLEYVHLATLQDRIYSAIRPAMRTVLVKGYWANWHLDGMLDAASFHRTLRSGHYMVPRYWTTDQILTAKNPPREFFFIAYPYVDNRPDLAWLTREYRVAAVQTFEESGYEMPVFRMRRK